MVQFLGFILIVFGFLLLAREFVVNGNQLCGRVFDVALFGSGRGSGGELDQELDIDRSIACTVEAWKLTGIATVPVVLGIMAFRLGLRTRREPNST